MMENPENAEQHSNIMQNFRDFVMKQAADCDPDNPLSPSQIALIEKRLLDVFPVFRTPTHPTYHAMIEISIVKLEKEGLMTTEELISEYITKNYDGLPWAHRRYLSHHLSRLCSIGEVVSVSGGCYALPGKNKQCTSEKKKKLKRKLTRRRKESVVEEENLGGEKLTEVIEDPVGIQEENVSMLRKKGRKRRRSWVIEDDEVGGTGSVGGEGNMICSGKVPVLEGPNEGLVLGSRKADGEGGQREQLHSGTVEEDINLVNVGKGSPKKLQVASFEGDCALRIDNLCSKEGEGEVKNKVLLSKHDPCEERAALKLALVPSTVMEVFPAEHEGEVTAGTSPLDNDSRDAHLMLVPLESVKESVLEKDHQLDSADLLLAPMACDSLASVSNTETDLSGAIALKSNLKVREYNLSDRQLMIVPFMDNTPDSAVRKRKRIEWVDSTIVCGLPYATIEDSNRKRQVCWKKRLTVPKETPKLLLEKVKPRLDFPALTMGHKQHLCDFPQERGLETKLIALPKSSKFKGVSVHSQQAYGSTALEDGSVEQLEKQKSSHPSCTVSHDELMSENLPLNQIFERCKRRKVRLPESISKVSSVTLSQSSGNHYKKLSNTETLVKTAQRVEPVSKRTKKQWQRKQPSLHGKNCYNPEVDTVGATISKPLPSFLSEQGGDSSTERHDNQQPCIDDSVADFMAECSNMKCQRRQQRQGHKCSSPNLEPTAETSLSPTEPHRLEDNQETRGDPGCLARPEQSPEVNISELSLTQSQCGQEERGNHQNESEMGSCDSELVKATVGEETLTLGNVLYQSLEFKGRKPKNKGHGRHPEVHAADCRLEDPSAKIQSQVWIADQGDKLQSQVCHYDAEPVAAASGERFVHTLDQSSQGLIEQPKQQCPGNPLNLMETTEETVDASLTLQHEQQEGASEPATNLIIEEKASILDQVDQMKCQELEIGDQIECTNIELSTAPTEKHGASDKLQSKQEKPQMQIQDELLFKELSSALYMRPLHQIGDREGQIQDEVTLGDEELSVATISGEKLPIAQQMKEPLALRRGRSGKHKEETKEDLEIKHLKKDGQGRHWKQKEATAEDPANSSQLHPQAPERLSEVATHQTSEKHNKQPEKRGPGRPKKLKETTIVEIDQPPVQPNEQSEKRGRGRPPKPKHATESDKKLPQAAIHQLLHQQNKEWQIDGQGRPDEHKDTTQEGAVDSSMLHLQVEKWPEQASDGHLQQQHKPLENDGRECPRKHNEATTEDAEDLSGPCLPEGEGLSEAETIQNLQQQHTLLKICGQGRPQKEKKAITENAAASSDPFLKQEETLSEVAKHSIQQIGRSRRKPKEATLEDPRDSSNMHLQGHEGSKVVADQHSQRKNKQLKIDCPARLRRPKEVFIEELTDKSNMHQELEGLSELETHKLSKQLNEQLKKDGQGRRGKQNAATMESSVAVPLNYVHQDEVGLSEQVKYHLSPPHHPSQQEQQNQPRRRSTRYSAASTAFTDSQNDKLCSLKVNDCRRPAKPIPAPMPSAHEPHGQEKDNIQHRCPDREPKELINIVHVTPGDVEQAKSPVDDKTLQQLRNPKQHWQGRLRQTKSVTSPSDNQTCQEQVEEHSHDYEQKQGKWECELRARKEKSLKSNTIEVPLSSKDQLRSRLKRQSQGSA